MQENSLRLRTLDIGITSVDEYRKHVSIGQDFCHRSSKPWQQKSIYIYLTLSSINAHVSSALGATAGDSALGSGEKHPAPFMMVPSSSLYSQAHRECLMKGSSVIVLSFALD